jgi:hypothetical protein
MYKRCLAAAILASFAAAHCAVAQETSRPAESTVPSPHPHIAYLDKSKTIYVAEFETAPSVPAKVSPIDSGSVGNPSLNGTGLEPVGDSQRITKLLAESLLHEIKTAGYKPNLLGAADPRPDEGLLITGVFTQMGKDGQLQRASVGPNQPTGTIQLDVTTSNLLRPAKPLYEIVEQDAGGQLAAAPIKLNPDVATLKFSLAGNPSDKAVRKTAEQIVAELQRLTLQAESEGLGGSDDPLNKYSKP